MSIKTVVDKERGCGWRKPGGLYIRSEGLTSSCGKLPLDLERCPCCGAGVKPTRGWTWVDPRLLFKDSKCGAEPAKCLLCPLGTAHLPERAGLLWIGGAYYKTPQDWIEESARLGVCRRLSALPHDLVVGETLVLAAHRQHRRTPDGKWVPAVFHAFRPTSVEYVVKGDETPEKLASLERRGIQAVKVVRDGFLPGVDEAASEQAAKHKAAAKAHVEAAKPEFKYESREASKKQRRKSKKGGAK